MLTINAQSQEGQELSLGDQLILLISRPVDWGRPMSVDDALTWFKSARDHDNLQLAWAAMMRAKASADPEEIGRLDAERLERCRRRCLS